jgi:hypothetical protein
MQETAFFDGLVALSSLRLAFADAGGRTLKLLTPSNVQDNKTKSYTEICLLRDLARFPL